MPIDVNPMREGRAATFDVEGRHSIQRKWVVETGDPGVDEQDVYDAMVAEGFPLGVAHPSIVGHYLKSYSIKESADDCTQWEVVGTYSQYDPAITGGTNPLAAKAQWTIRSNMRQVPVLVDANGDRVVNSAGEAFTQPATREFNEPVLVVTRNQAAIGPALIAMIASLDNKVNAGPFLGVFPPKTCRFVGWDIATNETHPIAGEYVTVQYQFKVKYDTWTIKLVDHGRNQLIGGKRKPIYTKDKTAIKSETTLLDGAGRVLGDDLPAVELAFEFYESADFETFGFTPAP